MADDFLYGLLGGPNGEPPEITVRHSEQKYIGHICSNCKCPVVSTTTIQVIATRTYSLRTEHEMRELVHKEADQAIQDAFSRIKNCKIAKTPLSDHDSIKRMNYWRKLQITDLLTPCPHCQHREAWQKGGVFAEELSHLDDIHFPVVLSTGAEVKSWLISYIDHTLKPYYDNIASQNKDNTVLQNEATKATLTYQKEQQQTEQELASFKEHLQLLSDKRQELVEQLASKRLFFIKKWRLKKEVRKLEREMSSYQKEKQKYIDLSVLQLKKLNISRHEKHLVAYGCTDKITLYSFGTMRFFLPQEKTPEGSDDSRNCQ